LDEFALYRQLETASKTSEASVKRPDRLIKDMDLILRLATKSDGNIVKTSILRLLFEKLYSLKSETAKWRVQQAISNLVGDGLLEKVERGSYRKANGVEVST